MEFKVNLNLKNIGDIDNIIVSFVLCAEQEFTFNDIVDLTIKYLDSYKLAYSKLKLEKSIDNKLNLLEKQEYISSSEGKYKIIKENIEKNQEENMDLGVLL